MWEQVRLLSLTPTKEVRGFELSGFIPAKKSRSSSCFVFALALKFSSAMLHPKTLAARKEREG